MRGAGPRREALASASASTLLLLFLAALLPNKTTAAPLDYFPLNSQLPPVARIDEEFSFVFSPLTFSSPLDITYTLADAPSWLAVDSGARRIYGTPSEDDLNGGGGEEAVVGIPITLAARDETGATAANATLVVSRNAAPTVGVPLSQQIPGFGPYSAPASLLLYPSRAFSFSFAADTFRAGRGSRATGGAGLNYYAVSADNAPLPSWVAFDAGSLTFSGTTPPFESLVQPPQTFGFQLVASDVVGFASASIAFSIVVGNHELTADEPVVRLNATHGRPFAYDGLPNILKFDKRPLSGDDVASIEALNRPDWLSFDDQSWKFSGTPDSSADSANVTVAVVDKFSDSLNVTLSIEFRIAIFVSDLPPLNLTAGEDFTFDLKRYLFKPSEVQVTVEAQPDAPWIHFDMSSMTLSGTAPEPLSASFANELHVTFNATAKHSADSETKDVDIHITIPSSTTATAAPTATSQPTPNADKDASRRNLLWLLLPALLLLCVAIIALLFYLRHRRQRPKKLDVVEVSAPIPGSFVANGPGSMTDGSLHDMRKILDIGPPPSEGGASAQHGYAPATSSNLRSSGTRSEPSVNGDSVPHAITTTMHSGVTRSRKEDNIIVESRDSWLAGQMPPQIGITGVNTDEVSMLSDTSLGESDAHITGADTSLVATKPGDDGFRGTLNLEVPMISEPFSIQATPELAYGSPRRRYEYSSDDEVPPAVGYVPRPRSGQPSVDGLGIRGVGRRLSKAFKRGSASRLLDERKRNSGLSTSTSQTTRTSILTSGIAEEAATTSTNIVARPTIIHIPSRPGEARQVSRRVDGSSPLFSGGSLTRHHRNFGLEEDTSPTLLEEISPKPPPAFKDFTATSRDSDTSWDRLARDSLGIAYKDLMKPHPESRKSLLGPRDSNAGLPGKVEDDYNWKIHHTSQELMSPDQWPEPNTFEGLSSTLAVPRGASEPPRLPPLKSLIGDEAPLTPGGKGKRRASTRRGSRGSGSGSNKTNTASSRSKSSRQSSSRSRDEQLRISRIREQRALDEFRAMMSKTPSPTNEWPMPAIRPLPETPTRPPRGPLTERLNESYSGDSGGRGMGGRSVVSKRSWKTARSGKSMRSVWGGDEDDDAWEDVRPPESVVDGWNGDGSDGSFSVYI
ncbi:hypothetical protein F4778DRAFT_170717 [Xylariomycetidae sp. FL2044]|nr:hypothetical protein F4778DRAFT_170717 [Xylariomycetidae sp. FL2044]